MPDREYLFRGRRLDNGEWAESSYPFGTLVGGVVVHDFDHTTVSQYTGLTDKNGTRIFEGDIVRYNSGEFDIHAVARVGEYEQDGSGGEYGPTKCVGVYFEMIDFTRPDWAEELAINPPDYLNTVSPFDSEVDEFEVIGNRWDNPELMPPPPGEEDSHD